jgi:hypothetical protein
VNPQRETWKIVIGAILLILTPLSLFVKPTTVEGALRDLVLVIWWAFVLWLLRSGFRGSDPASSK